MNQLTESELLPGLMFTGKNGCFKYRIEIIGLNHSMDEIVVELTQPVTASNFSNSPNVLNYSIWCEQWSIKSVIEAFHRGDYIKQSDWPQYPPDHKQRIIDLNAANLKHGAKFAEFFNYHQAAVMFCVGIKPDGSFIITTIDSVDLITLGKHLSKLGNDMLTRANEFKKIT